jgi:hypothetical protein
MEIENNKHIYVSWLYMEEILHYNHYTYVYILSNCNKNLRKIE